MSPEKPKIEVKLQLVTPRACKTRKISIRDRIAPGIDRLLVEECNLWFRLMGPLGTQLKQLGELDLGQSLENSLREVEEKALLEAESPSIDDLYCSSSQEISKLAKLRRNKRQRKHRKLATKQHTTEHCEPLNVVEVDKYLDSYVEMKIEEENQQAGLFMWNFD